MQSALCVVKRTMQDQMRLEPERRNIAVELVWEKESKTGYLLFVIAAEKLLSKRKHIHYYTKSTSVQWVVIQNGEPSRRTMGGPKNRELRKANRWQKCGHVPKITTDENSESENIELWLKKNSGDLLSPEK